MHAFEKPNDERALNLMNACATSMLEKFPDIVFAYGVSDEYRYVTCSYMKLIIKLFAYFLSKKGMQILMWTLCFEMHRLIISACLPVCFLQFCFQRGNRILSEAGKVSDHFFTLCFRILLYPKLFEQFNYKISSCYLTSLPIYAAKFSLYVFLTSHLSTG
jgi:hypothetical protein